MLGPIILSRNLRCSEAHREAMTNASISQRKHRCCTCSRRSSPLQGQSSISIFAQVKVLKPPYVLHPTEKVIPRTGKARREANKQTKVVEAVYLGAAPASITCSVCDRSSA